MGGSAGDAYDALPYTDHAYAEAHPDRLAVVARLSGWEAAAPETARVLELGCARGGHLLPMASALPGATLVGVDRSRAQIEEARRIAGATALANVRFEIADFAAGPEAPPKAGRPPEGHARPEAPPKAGRQPEGHARPEAPPKAGRPPEGHARPEAPPKAGRPPEGHARPHLGAPFDYVVCHGVASWIAPAARRALLRAVAQALAPDGVAYVSFNVLPGWYERLAARDWLRGAPPDDPAVSLRWLRDQVSPELADYRRRLEVVATRLATTDRPYAVHEYLAAEHHPLPVSVLLEEAAGAGLAYLGDAIPGETALELLPDAVAVRARGLDARQVQQLVDFVRNTAFRRTLLVRADTCARRGWTWPDRLRAEALQGLRAASRLRPGTARDEHAFRSAEVTVQVHDASARAALRELARVAPRSLPVRELGAGALHAELLDLWLATGAIDLHVYEPPLGDGASARALACPVARWHARHGGAVTNRWHQEVALEEPLLRRVLALLDGSRDAAAVARDARCTDEDATAAVRALAAAALLVA